MGVYLFGGHYSTPFMRLYLLCVEGYLEGRISPSPPLVVPSEESTHTHVKMYPHMPRVDDLRGHFIQQIFIDIRENAL